jgi:hypothetical protein
VLSERIEMKSIYEVDPAADAMIGCANGGIDS